MADLLRRPDTLTPGDLGTVVAVHGRELRPPCPPGPATTYRGELLTLSITPDGVDVVLDVDGARIRVLLARPA